MSEQIDTNKNEEFWDDFKKKRKPSKSDLSNSLVNRLRGQYDVGENNEFGTRSFADFIPPISLEAADKIEGLEHNRKQALLYLQRIDETECGKNTWDFVENAKEFLED